MELPSKFLEQIAFITTPKLEEHMLIVMDKSIHEEHLAQPLQTNNKQFKIAVTFLTGYNGIWNVTHNNNKIFFKINFDEGYFFQVTIPHGAYELEVLRKKLEGLILIKVIIVKTVIHSL